MAVRTAVRDMAALTRSKRPASGSRNSGSSVGPRTSSSPITGRAIRKTEPHQKRFSSTPTDERADSAARRDARDPHADGDGSLSGVEEHVSDERERRRRERRTGHAEQGAGRDEHGGAHRKGRGERDGAEGASADQEKPSPTDPVSQGAHRDEESREQEPVDVGDPQQLSATVRSIA